MAKRTMVDGRSQEVAELERAAGEALDRGSDPVYIEGDLSRVERALSAFANALSNGARASSCERLAVRIREGHRAITRKELSYAAFVRA